MRTRAPARSATYRASCSSSANMPMVMAFSRSGRFSVATSTPSVAWSSWTVSSRSSSLLANVLLLHGGRRQGVPHLGDNRARGLFDLVGSQAPGRDDEVEVLVAAGGARGPLPQSTPARRAPPPAR